MVSDVQDRTLDLVGVDGFLIAEPFQEVAGGVWVAAAVQVCVDAREGGRGIDVEGGDAPFRFGLCRFFLEGDDAVVVVQLRNAPALAVFRVFDDAHADIGRGVAFIREDEVFKWELQDVVGGQDDDVVGDVVRVKGEPDVAHGAEAVVVGGGAVVEDVDAQAGVRPSGPSRAGHARLRPVLEVAVEAMVGDEAGAVDVRDLFERVDKVVQDGFSTDF